MRPTRQTEQTCVRRRGRGRTRPVYVGFEMRRDLTASWGRGGWIGAVIVGFPDYLELCEWMRSGM